MNTVDWLLSQLDVVVLYTVPFLVVLTVIIFFHEMGHFLVARWCGVKVDAFSIGFGREILGFTDSKGTRWKVGWLPLGGYVKFFDDEDIMSTQPVDPDRPVDPEARRVSFHEKPLWQRAAIVAAGPIANFLLAIVIFAAIFGFVGRTVTAAKVDEIQAGSAAEIAGFQVGDVIKSIDGAVIESFAVLQRFVSIRAGNELTFGVERDGAPITLRATPKREERVDQLGTKTPVGLLGISRKTAEGDIVVERLGPGAAVWMGVKETWFVIDRTFAFLKGLVAGRESAEQLGGPLRIAQYSAALYSISLTAYINLAAVLSVSIGLLNLFPIPMLDGGHLLYYAIEAIRGKPMSERMIQMGFKFGMAAVLMLMIFATWQDLLQIRDRIGAF
jgi:regulator of sigma E protease